MDDPLSEALKHLAHIENAVTQAGYNCSCAAAPDNVSIDKDWLEVNLRALKKSLLLAAPLPSAEIAKARQLAEVKLGQLRDAMEQAQMLGLDEPFSRQGTAL